MRRIALVTLIVGACVPFLSVAPASAQATRTWVSGVGDDANPCSRTAPCKTFAGAISKTATFGEINVLDPGGFGAVTITKSISIIADHVEAGVLVAGTNGIIVSLPAATDRVLLQGLDIEGLGVAGSVDGVKIVGSGTTTIERCSIRHFGGNGVNLVGTSGARAVVKNSIITNNAANGFIIAGAGGVQNTGISLDTLYDNNPTSAINVTAPSNLIIGGNEMLGSAAAVVSNGGASVTTFGNNAAAGSLPTLTPNPLK
jgi:hypothetical protein